MTTATDAKELISDLNDLIELDYDAIAAYKAAGAGTQGPRR